MSEKAGLTHAGIRKWIDEVAALTSPDRILICDGSEAEKDALIKESLAAAS
jgi:phosphoenolpyruvate carboxykinase (GTP)